MSEHDVNKSSGKSVVRLISDLLASKPDVHAPKIERAIWFERKAVVFQEIAAVGDPEHVALATESARAAQRTAVALRVAALDEARNEALRDAATREGEQR